MWRTGIANALWPKALLGAIVYRAHNSFNLCASMNFHKRTNRRDLSRREIFRRKVFDVSSDISIVHMRKSFESFVDWLMIDIALSSIK